MTPEEYAEHVRRVATSTRPRPSAELAATLRRLLPPVPVTADRAA